MTETPTGSSRRLLKTRQTLWAAALSRALARSGVRPNAVSLLGVVFALLAGMAFASAPTDPHPEITWAAGALSVQLRLLCNMLDGMLAIEGGFKSRLGDLYNDLPDRISDVLILVGAGYSVEEFVPGGADLGWLAAVLAVLTAYVRVLGGTMGVKQSFAGPMAKQHRMFIITLGAIGAAVQAATYRPGWAMVPALVIVVIGSGLTIVRRTRLIVRDLMP